MVAGKARQVKMQDNANRLTESKSQKNKKTKRKVSSKTKDKDKQTMFKILKEIFYVCMKLQERLK